MFRVPGRLAILTLTVLIWASMASALAAANTVPGSKASDTTRAITPNDLKPTECAGVALTAKIVGSGTISGGAAAELIIGSAGNDTITGGGGSDCILGGGGDDNINGNGGPDVILGGPGNDTINGGAGADTCYGGTGTDTFTSCATTFDP